MDPIITFEIVIILSMLLVGMILINIQLLEHELVIPIDMTNLLIAVALLIEVLDTISMVLSPNSLQGHIFLIMDHPANHLSQYIQVMKSIKKKTHSSNEQFFQPHSHFANYRPDLYAHRRTNDDDDFEPPRHSTWY